MGEGKGRRGRGQGRGETPPIHIPGYATARGTGWCTSLLLPRAPKTIVTTGLGVQILRRKWRFWISKTSSLSVVHCSAIKGITMLPPTAVLPYKLYDTTDRYRIIFTALYSPP